MAWKNYSNKKSATLDTETRKDAYETITERLLEMIEKDGVLPWSKPWDMQGNYPCNLQTKKVYSGSNVFTLWFQQMNKGYETSWWVTYNQAKALGGQVRKGEKGTVCVKWIVGDKKDKETGEATGDKFFKPMVFTVFNVAQCDDLEDKIPTKEERTIEPIEHCEKIGSMMLEPIEIRHGGDRAFYRPSEDFIQLPPRNAFHDVTEYYSTRFHEMVHSTGSTKRLNRASLVDLVAFGDTNYSKEELVAELGAAFLCAHAGINNTASEKNSAAYLQGWSRKLREDKKLFYNAAKEAQAALDYIIGKQNSPEETTEEE